LVGLCVLVSGASARNGNAILDSRGIAGAHFGETESAALAALTSQFGAPTRRLPNTGCGPLFREIEWRHLYAEFRGQTFEGVRYIAGAWPIGNLRPATGRASAVLPRVATAKGISLGSTLGDVRAAYKPLRLIGTDRWRSSGDLIFYDNARRDPPPSSSRIVEIKAGVTCGDF
jgi:hypothetical protein